MDKPFLDHDELIRLMGSRGLDPGEHARFVLEREGYYPVVNGYRRPFLDGSSGDPERYKAGATFDELYALFVMDRRLRSVVFRFATLAEATLKSVSAYEFCAEHPRDNEAYLSARNYRRDKAHRAEVGTFVHDLELMLDRVPGRHPKSMRGYLRHYAEAHDNVPLWVTMNGMTLTQAYKFFDFQPEPMRNRIARRFSELHAQTHEPPARISPKALGDAYGHIKDFRNICAHDERLYCARVDKSQSTGLSRLMGDFYLVLTADDCRSLRDSVFRCLDFVAPRLHTIGEGDVLGAMGFSSRDEIARRLEVGR